MKKIGFVISVLGALHLVTSAQSEILSTGDVRIVRFGPTNMAFASSLYDPLPGAQCDLSFGNDTFDPSDVLRLDFFEQDLDSTPFRSITRQGDFNVGYLWRVEEPGGWQDFQGVVRLTVVSGTVDLEEFLPSVIRYGAWYVYSEVPQPVPEPAPMLRPREVYSTEIRRFPYHEQLPLPSRPPFPAPAGWVIVIIRNGPQLPAGTSLRLELFENSTAESPVCSQTVQFPLTGIPNDRFGCSAPNAWQDFQGALRITMLNGSARIDEIFTYVSTPSTTPGYYDQYSSKIRPAAPRLRISRSANEPLQIRWPEDHVGYVLEFAHGQFPAQWAPHTNPIIVLQGEFTANLDATSVQRIYRLRRP